LLEVKTPTLMKSISVTIPPAIFQTYLLELEAVTKHKLPWTASLPSPTPPESPSAFQTAIRSDPSESQ